ncbi:MAG: hypothetical protein HY332_15965 [Chloroflexi bacterium]|nr:hypothetical protein [Chloroflexota bacterium]
MIVDPLSVVLTLVVLVTVAAAAVRWWRTGHRRPGYLPPVRTLQRRALQVRHSYRLRAEAERRAELLLRDLLGDASFYHFLRRGYLEVRSLNFPNRTYLIPERQGPVTVCDRGRPVMRLCVQCVERVPEYDTVVMHKLMIEGNEQEYLRIANRV